MPELFRIPAQMVCGGIDLVTPVDKMRPGMFPYLLNVRVVQEGRIEPRGGYSRLFSTPLTPALLHSIRRLNNQITDSYLYIIGNGTELFTWNGTGEPSEADTGYSGLPLSLIVFRPSNTPEAWMYVFDANKSIKVNAEGQTREVGVAPPAGPPHVEYGVPALVIIEDYVGASGYVAYGTASSPQDLDRTNSSNPTIAAILYPVGQTTGWCWINPNLNGQTFWTGNRMRPWLNLGQANQDLCVVREVWPAIANTTVSAIAYDSGSTGKCSIVLAPGSGNLSRNSLIQIDSEMVRVESVISTPDGVNTSIRCYCTMTHTAGAAVTGLVSWYTYAGQNHAPGETISSLAVICSSSSAGTGSLAKLHMINAALANSRPVSLANDYLHISLFLVNPQFVTQANIMLDIDPSTTSVGGGGNAFTGNYLSATVTAAQLNQFGPGNIVGDSWTEVVIPLSSMTRFGNDATQTLANIMATQVQVVTAGGGCAFAFNSWHIFGTYGPNLSALNSPTGLSYQTVYRDTGTGAQSVPSPQPYYQIFPLREQVFVTPVTTTQPGINDIDVYRQGAAITNYVYDGSVGNFPSNPQAFSDTQPDTSIAAQQQTDLTQIQPFPIIQTARIGTVNTCGTTVTWVSGNQFDLQLLGATVILINGVTYVTQGQPLSATMLLVTQSAGVQMNAPYQINNPTLFGQPLPVVFGALEGPFAPVVFGLGDPLNAGTLYYTNLSNVDAASDANTLELCAPSTPLISGDVWNGYCFAGNKADVFLVRYSYLTTIGASTSTTYQWSRIPTASGMWARHACKAGPDGVYFIGQDGWYRATEQGCENISDEHLYPLFPHANQPAQFVNNLYPVNMNLPDSMRLSTGDNEINFDYTDTNGGRQRLRYDIKAKRFFAHNYNDPMSVGYLVEHLEGDSGATQQILLGQTSGLFYLTGGDTDDSAAITSLIQTPAYDGGDNRSTKLFEYGMFDYDATSAAALSISALYNDLQIAGPSFTFNAAAGVRTQGLGALITGGFVMAAYRNVGYTIQLKGGPDGTRLYALESTGYLQPYLTAYLVTQFINLSVPGWKMHRRLYAGYISNSQLLFTIRTQDGRTYGPYTLPSSGGQFRVFPQMLNSTIKDLSFSYQLDAQGQTCALFDDSFTIETKLWTEPDYLNLAIFKT